MTIADVDGLEEQVLDIPAFHAKEAEANRRHGEATVQGDGAGEATVHCQRH